MPTTAMADSPLALVLLGATLISIVLVLSLTALTLYLIVLCAVCALFCGVMVFNALWLFCISIIVTQYHPRNPEATQLLTNAPSSDPTHQNVQPDPSERSTTSALQSGSVPMYCTPLEMLNSMSSETDPCDDQSVRVQTTVATVVDEFEDDFTFATCPFTSPPVFKIEIFVSTETVVYDDVVGSFAFGTPPNSLLMPSYALSDAAMHSLSELIEHCDDAIMESKAGDVDLI